MNGCPAMVSAPVLGGPGLAPAANATLPGPVPDAVESVGLFSHAALKRLFVDGGFVHQHDGNLVPNRVEPMAGDTAQPAAVSFHFHLCPAGRTNQYFEQFRADSHFL